MKISKLSCSCLLVGLLVVAGIFAEDPAVGTGSDFEAFKARHAEIGKTPEGAVKLWFDAVFLYVDQDTRDLGRESLEYLTIGFKENSNWDRLPSNAMFVSRLKGEEHHYIFRSYAVGATPENGYEMDPTTYELRVDESVRDAHGRGWKVALESSGADSPRPVYLRQSTTTGLWYVSIWANIYVGVRAPKDPAREEFR